MTKFITAALGTIAAFVVAVLIAPTAQALVPPDPSGSSTSPSAAVDSATGLLSSQTVLVAVVAVAVGAALALVVQHFARRSHADGLAPA